MGWQLLARMPDRTPGGLLRGWSLDLTLKLNEVGNWKVVVPRELTPAGWPTPGCGLIILRDGVVVASGNVDNQEFTWSAQPGDVAAGPGVYTLTGDTDLGRIAYRTIYPTPGQPWESQGNSYWVYPLTGTSNAEDVMRVTVNRQVGSLALTERRVPGLRLGTATGTGTQIRISERFTPLLDALRKTALAGGGLVFDALDTLDGGCEFVVRAPLDVTENARFGVELGNITELNVSLASPVTTVALIAGGGELANRDLAEIADTAANPAWGRREQFIDQRQVDEGDPENPDAAAEKAAEYAKAAAEAFADGGEQTSVQATIRDTPAVQWGRDYNLGDKVSALTPFGPVADLVREVRITVDETGLETIDSTVGTQEATTADPLASTVRAMAKRISQLERAL